jgi:hypothetical protein
VVVLGALHVEVRLPAELAVNVAFLDKAGPLRHARAFDLVQLTRVLGALRPHGDDLLLLKRLVKQLLEVNMIRVVEVRGAVVVPLVPLVFVGRKHAIIAVFLHEDVSRGVRNVPTHRRMLLKDACEALAAKR